MSSYILGKDAARDIEDIWEYIASDNVIAADRLIERFFDDFEVLARSPEIGHKRGDLTTAPVRFWPIGNYLVIYRTQRGKPIEIVGVVHGNREVPLFLTGRNI